MNIIPPFPFIRPGSIDARLTEDGFTPKFSAKQKIYYNLVRPYLPIPLRQKLQERLGTKVEFNTDFIDDSLVREILSQDDSRFLADFHYPSKSRAALLLTHDVEEEAGFNHIPKIIELEQKHGFCSSWNIVPYKYKMDEGILRLIRESGHEIGIHGYNHDGKLYFSERIFTLRAKFINEALQRYGAVGFRSPMVHRNLRWLQKLDIIYDASCFDYDPFQPFPGGTGSIWPFIAGKFVEIPYTIPQDHTLFYAINAPDIDLWKRKTDWVIKNKGVITVLTHPDYLVAPRQAEMYEEYLKFLKEINGLYHTIPANLAKWWQKISLEFGS